MNITDTLNEEQIKQLLIETDSDEFGWEQGNNDMYYYYSKRTGKIVASVTCFSSRHFRITDYVQDTSGGDFISLGSALCACAAREWN
jgi:hypothetical protein